MRIVRCKYGFISMKIFRHESLSKIVRHAARRRRRPTPRDAARRRPNAARAAALSYPRSRAHHPGARAGEFPNLKTSTPAVQQRLSALLYNVLYSHNEQIPIIVTVLVHVSLLAIIMKDTFVYR